MYTIMAYNEIQSTNECLVIGNLAAVESLLSEQIADSIPSDKELMLKTS